MTKKRKYLISLILLVFVTGCGESFRSGEQVQPSESETEDFYNRDGFANSRNPLSYDEKILSRYKKKNDGRIPKARSLTNKIKAFDINLIQSSRTQLRVRARVTLGCDKFRDFDKEIKIENLFGLERISLGKDKSYSLKMECTTSRCHEMVIAIADSATKSLVLSGLSVADDVDGSLVYIGRRVPITPEFTTFPSYAQYTKNPQVCPASLEDIVKDAARDYVTDKVVDRIVGSDNLEARDALKEILGSLF